jgi:hypothetical protein
MSLAACHTSASTRIGVANSNTPAGIVNKVGSYEWSIPANLGDDETYGFVIRLESNPGIFQYSFPFHIEANEDAAPSNSTQPTVAPTSTGSDNSTISSTAAVPEKTISANITTAEPPKTTVVTSTSTKASPKPTGEPETEDPVTVDPGSAAATHGAVGSLALVGAIAAAAFAL